MKKCSACKQRIEGLATKHEGRPVNGSLLKGIQTVYVCERCTREQEQQTAISFKRHAAEQVQMIEGMIEERPDLASTLQKHLEHWKAEAN